jgi:hypothetical protein
LHENTNEVWTPPGVLTGVLARAGRLLAIGIFVATGALTAIGPVQAQAPVLQWQTVTENLRLPRPLAPPAAGPFGPPAPDMLAQRVAATWPEDADRALRILHCESTDGLNPYTYDLGAANGGPMQINRYTWADYFSESFGWSWDEVVKNLDIHLKAARHVYDRSGSWYPWECYTDGLSEP